MCLIFRVLTCRFINTSKIHFFSFEAPGIQRGYLVEVKTSSQEYKSIEDHFNKKWSHKERKAPPLLQLVLAVINPFLDDKISLYKQLHLDREKKDTKLVKKLFYGTKLGCDLNTYQVTCRLNECKECKIPCTQDHGQGKVEGCGVCHVALYGFGQLSMTGVTLDKNPGHSHDKAKAHVGSLTYGLLMCEVACTNTRTFRRHSLSESEVRHNGYDSVAMTTRKGSFLNLKKSTDEVVVYKGDAVCPRYILLYV